MKKYNLDINLEFIYLFIFIQYNLGKQVRRAPMFCRVYHLMGDLKTES